MTPSAMVVSTQADTYVSVCIVFLHSTLSSAAVRWMDWCISFKLSLVSFLRVYVQNSASENVLIWKYTRKNHCATLGFGKNNIKPAHNDCRASRAPSPIYIHTHLKSVVFFLYMLNIEGSFVSNQMGIYYWLL